MLTAANPPSVPAPLVDLPPPLLAALNSKEIPRRPWQSTLAPHFIGLFLWVAYFDQIPRETLSIGGLLWPVLGSGLGGLLSYLLLYRTPAVWSLTTGRPLSILSTSTFGVEGATYVPGLLLAATQIIWLAVSTSYGTTLTLRGLVFLQVLDPKYLQPVLVGQFNLPSLLFLIAALFWCLEAAFVGRYIVSIIAALMNIYPILPALILGVGTLLALRGLRGFEASGAAFVVNPGRAPPQLAAVVIALQMVFAFSTTAGLAAGDWGASVRGRYDIRLGGLVGILFAPWIVATLAILTVAGAGPQRDLSYVAAIESLIGGRMAGATLMAFGLAALAPAVYASFSFSTRVNATYPKVSKTHATLLVSLLAWLLVASGLANRMFEVFSVVGGLLAPVAGAMAADRLLARGAWPGARRGYNLPGWLAWTLGSAVGLTPTVARLFGSSGGLAAIQPAALYAFLVAFLVYIVAAASGVSSSSDPRIPPRAS